MSAARPADALEATLQAFADRLFRTGGVDPGDAAIPLPAARLELYRGLVRKGYLSMLRYAHPCALRLVRHEGQAAGGTAGIPPGAEEAVRRFLEVDPSSTFRTREIADRFAAFLPREYPALVERRPELADLMRLERAELEADYHADDPGEAVARPAAEALARLSVDEFLALRVVRAPSSSVLALARPVLGLRAEIARRRFPPSPPAGPEHVVVSRDPATLRPVSSAVLEEEALCLELAPPGVPEVLEELAARWIDALPAGAAARDDAWKLATFARAVAAAFAAGALRRA